MKLFSYTCRVSIALAALVSCSDGKGSATDDGNNAGGDGGSQQSGGDGGKQTPNDQGGAAQGGSSMQGGTGGQSAGGSGGRQGDAGTTKPSDAGGSDPVTPPPGSPATLLGKGDHSAGSIKLTALGVSAGCLAKPSDIAFNPRRKTELWATNNGDDSACIIMDVASTPLKSERRLESSHEHFMPRPMGLAFGGDFTTFGIPGTFATANDSAGDGNPDDGQMWNGTVLWSSDLSLFGKFKGPDGNSHLDMLHDSPNARGIAWEKDNIYWVFGSMLQDITKYDFAKDHDRGNFDHGDGLQWHYAAGMVKGVNGVPSHLAFDSASKMLYIADTGNKRIARLDTASGTLNPKRHTRLKDRVESKIDAVMDGAKLTEVVPASAGLLAPAGLELFENVLFVSDFNSGIIYAFDLEGHKLNWIDTGLGAGKVAGLAVGPDRKLYFASMGSNAIYVVAP